MKIALTTMGAIVTVTSSALEVTICLPHWLQDMLAAFIILCLGLVLISIAIYLAGPTFLGVLDRLSPRSEANPQRNEDTQTDAPGA